MAQSAPRTPLTRGARAFSAVVPGACLSRIRTASILTSKQNHPVAFSSSAQKLLPCFVWHIFLREENVFWLSIFSAFWKQNVDQAVEGGREGRGLMTAVWERQQGLSMQTVEKQNRLKSRKVRGGLPMTLSRCGRRILMTADRTVGPLCGTGAVYC